MTDETIEEKIWRCYHDADVHVHSGAVPMEKLVNLAESYANERCILELMKIKERTSVIKDDLFRADMDYEIDEAISQLKQGNE